MIRLLIIEDEPPAVKRLVQMIDQIDMDVKIVDCLDTVENAIKYLRNFNNVDLIISDIQLADGNSFEIFSQVEVKVPVIFATAFDEYMLQAFKVNSIDYLLKPYDQDDLIVALSKYKNYYAHNTMASLGMQELLFTLSGKKYKERFLVKKGKELIIIPTDQICYFYSEDGYVHLMGQDGSKYIVEFTLENLADVLDPSMFFRINRKFYIQYGCIRKIHPYFNSRLKLEISPKCGHDAIVSREKVNEFKQWLDQ